MSSIELLTAFKPTADYSTHIPSYYTKYNSNGEIYFDGNRQSVGSLYIPINPSGKTYYWDLILSQNIGNQFYVGFERYDKDFTPRSNNACVYVYSTKAASDLSYARYKGTINLSTDGVNPCAYIALRILNGWIGTTSGVTGTATIHYLSLREVTISEGFETSKIHKTGVITCDTLEDKNDKMSIEKAGLINGYDLMEI